MGAPFVYRPTLSANHHFQASSFPYSAQQYLHTPSSNYPFHPALRPPNILPSSYSSTHNRFPVPLPTPSTQGQQTLRTLTPVDRGYGTWTPPPRSRSVPADHEQRVQNLQSPHPRAMSRLSAPYQNSFDNPWNAAEPNWRGEQWLQNPQFPGQQRQDPRANGLAPFGNAWDPPLTTRQPPTQDPSAFLYINSWISAPNPSTRFIFDLSAPECAPRLESNGRKVRLARMELMQPVTSPPCTRMHVIIDAIPQWPCEIVPHSTHVPQLGDTMSPITLRDVLRSLYKHLHQHISRHDWDQLGGDMQKKVTWAFMTRCDRHVDARAERNKGVKRVDFLLQETKMVGLWWVERRDGCEIMKLILQS